MLSDFHYKPNLICLLSSFITSFTTKEFSELLQTKSLQCDFTSQIHMSLFTFQSTADRTWTTDTDVLQSINQTISQSFKQAIAQQNAKEQVHQIIWTSERIARPKDLEYW